MSIKLCIIKKINTQAKWYCVLHYVEFANLCIVYTRFKFMKETKIARWKPFLSSSKSCNFFSSRRVCVCSICLNIYGCNFCSFGKSVQIDTKNKREFHSPVIVFILFKKQQTYQLKEGWNATSYCHCESNQSKIFKILNDDEHFSLSFSFYISIKIKKTGNKWITTS